MKISRHFIRIGNRRVHYRKSGNGPPLLMIHQSPRSSAEYEPLMEQWGQYFTCIAPDSPGFGQSDPLPGHPEIADFSNALIELLDALGLRQAAAYGFHSGGIILVNAARLHPGRFTSLAIGGYAIWTPEERAIFDTDYLPPFQPSGYGEHLTWLWNRMLEQSWFFPWFDVRNEARMSVAHADLPRIDAAIRDMLDSGDAYRAGYGAVLRAPRDIPGRDEETIPTLIAAYDGDPLQQHMARLGELPPNWRAEPVRTPAALHQLCLEHLRSAPAAPIADINETRDGGFVHVRSTGFDGLIHWQGDPQAQRVMIHAPGRSVELVEASGMLAIDLPGHGLSDGWSEGFTPSFDDWSAVAAEAISALSKTGNALIIGEGFSALLAAAAASRLGAGAWGGTAAHIPLSDASAAWAEQAIPNPAPDRHGSYLNAAWNAVRASHFFWPWFDARAANAIPFAPADIAPEALAREHRSLIRGRSARDLMRALAAVDREAIVAAAPRLERWERADWAASRTDLWSPAGAP